MARSLDALVCAPAALSWEMRDAYVPLPEQGDLDSPHVSFAAAETSHASKKTAFIAATPR